jgi:DNA-binding phage protein
MMTPEQIRQALKDRNIQAVAKASGVSAHSIYRLLNKDGKPLYLTIAALSEYLEGKNQ